jgi:hypothetical protein
LKTILDSMNAKAWQGMTHTQAATAAVATVAGLSTSAGRVRSACFRRRPAHYCGVVFAH